MWWVNLLIGLGGALIGSVLSPFVGNFVWKIQRRDEIRLGAIEDLNTLAAQFFVKSKSLEKDTAELQEFLWEFERTEGKIVTLFSGPAVDEFKRLQEFVGANFQGRDQHEFIQARDSALRALYSEIGISVPRRKQWTRTN